MSSILLEFIKTYCKSAVFYDIIRMMKYKELSMAITQIYEKIVKVKDAKQTAKLISAILFYLLYLLIWIFAGILNPERSILIFIGGILSCLLIILITWKYLFIEYEYSFCQSTLTVSKIYGKRKRKALIDINISKLALVCPATEENIQKAEHLTPERRIISVSNEYADDIFLLVTGEENEPRVLIFIEADERALAILKSYATFAFTKKS